MKIEFGSFEDFIMQEVKRGIPLKYADIIFGKYFIYFLTPKNILYPCIIYNSLLSPKAHKDRLKPLLHFYNCKNLYDILYLDSTKVKITRKNLFDYNVGLNKRYASKLFYDIPLPFCPLCVETYKLEFNNFYEKNYNEDFVFFDCLDDVKIKEEQIAISSNIAISNNYSLVDVNIGNGNFYLSYKRNVFGSLA
ncbi:hypothetical protein [Helicobacter sp. MIT 14-3879]|uniref:hypothetical protein n=1 Tax=Helicobacter sp. MIT 14-3879 TaxID=2040649 RepID=UPI000E1EE350|nr:hypothetical protein [Helicobacter sp. MIT 14-3879]RDU63955.1 hypothetical protein CQA44_04765 [Helicobacter sp. MIT 14-3879]